MLACCELESPEREHARVVLRPAGPNLLPASPREFAAPAHGTEENVRLEDDAKLRAAAQAFLLRVGS
jgi:hypothetical protein